MLSSCRSLGVALFALVLCGGFDAQASPASSAPKTGDKNAISAKLAAVPMRFEPNEGQFDERVLFLGRAPGYNLFLTREGATLGFHAQHAGDVADTSTLRMHVVGGRSVQPAAFDALAGISNYFAGNDPSKWRTGVEGYARVRYSNVLPGVDVDYYGAGGQRLEYDLVVAPGADPNGVTLALDGAQSIEIDAKGAAHLTLHEGREVVQPAPFAYQRDALGKRERVEAHYVRRADGLGFAVGRFDATRALVIDPTLVYSTYLGGSGSDGAFGVAIDSSGSLYIAGTTTSTNFPDAVFPSSDAAGNYHVFVTKLNPTGSAIVYSTYLGGNGSDFANDLALDSAGEAFVVGTTSSTNFPIASALQSTYGGGSYDAFVTKLSTTGSVSYSTYVGGSLDDQAEGVAVDGAGEAFVTGLTFSTNFRTVSPLQGTNLAAGGTAFVAKLNIGGSALVYSTYLGGNGVDSGNAIALDAAGDAFVVGSTTSTNFPTASPLQSSLGGSQDAFVAKLTLNGSTLTLAYSTYLGGNAAEYGNGIAVDSAGDAFVVGSTASTNFPTASALQGALGGPEDAFVAKLTLNGSTLTLAYSTYLGGSAADYGNGIAVDSANEAFVTGYTSSTDFPTASPIQSTNAGKQDVFVARYSAAGTTLLYSTYLGGSDNDLGNRIALDASGNAVVVGELGQGSTNFPMVSPVQGAEDGSDDALIVKIASPLTGAPPAPAIGSNAARILAGLMLLCGVVMLSHGGDRRRRIAI
jgi:Beta-propeller repeat